MHDVVAGASFLQLVAGCAVGLFGYGALCLALGFGAERWLGERRRIFGVALDAGQLRRETLGSVRFGALASVAFGAMLAWIEHAPDTAGRIALTFFVCWAGFEAYYWALHRAMHTPLGFRFHRHHHDSRVMTPMTGYSMSAVEALGWLVGLAGPLVLLSLVMPVSVTGWVAYLAYHVSGNIVGHANVELLGSVVSRRPVSWWMHPITYHALHHARINNHYGFGSTFMDRWLRTEWDDWPVLHARVLAGAALQRLTERGGSATAGVPTTPRT